MKTIGDLEKLAGLDRNDGTNDVFDFYYEIDKNITLRTGSQATGSEVLETAVKKMNAMIRVRVRKNKISLLSEVRS
jgi:hypothetical protein